MLSVLLCQTEDTTDLILFCHLFKARFSYQLTQIYFCCCCFYFVLRFQSPLQLALSGEEGWGADIHHLAASARLSGSSASVRSGGETGGTADR